MSRAYRLPWMVVAIGAVAMLAGCERPPIDSVQYGFRGTGMVQVYNPRTMAEQIPLNQPPPPPGPATPEGPKAKEIFKNVKLLGELSVADFTRFMTSMTSWVAPKEGCAYCHDLTNLPDDGKYTKVVARRMIEMTQHVNADWKLHVAATGVTCYTCHRGNPVPTYVWFNSPGQKQGADFIGDQAGQNQAAEIVGLTSLPYDPLSPYLQDAKTLRVNGTTALPTGNRASLKQAEFTYGLMIHMSNSLGVNCTFCHNTHNFAVWDGPPQRVTAWHGIQMTRDLNTQYLEGLKPVFPANRLGPLGDVAKVSCISCHQGAYKPLYAAQMAKDFPELLTFAGSPTAKTPVADAAAKPVAVSVKK